MACYPGQPTRGAVEGPRADLLIDAPADLYQQSEEGEGLRPQTTQRTVSWLMDTYHYQEGICLPRSTIYEHYMDNCSRDKLKPVNAASFGKMIRQQFPVLTTRRLGTRGQSKYHYYGLGIQPSSVYYTEEYLQSQKNQGTPRKEPETKKQIHALYASKDKPSALLPPFPDVLTLQLSASVPRSKLHTFMVMYRTHCQRILDSVVRTNFNEIEEFLLHFWQGMPSHLLPALSCDIVVDLIALCDSSLYRAITNVLIIDPLSPSPDSLTTEVLQFASSLRSWMDKALNGLPPSLLTAKFQVADTFCRSLKRQTSLMHLADAVRNVLKGEESLEQLQKDWSSLDLTTVLTHTLYAIEPLDIPERCSCLIPQFLEGFSELIAEQSTVEDFALWVEAALGRCVKKTDTGRMFLLSWKFFISKIVRELTLQSAPSFGTFHLLQTLIDDYIIHYVENLLEQEKEKEYSDRIELLKHDDSAAADIKVEDRLALVQGTPMDSSTASPITMASSMHPATSAQPSHSFAASLDEISGHQTHHTTSETASLSRASSSHTSPQDSNSAIPFSHSLQSNASLYDGSISQDCNGSKTLGDVPNQSSTLHPSFSLSQASTHHVISSPFSTNVTSLAQPLTSVTGPLETAPSSILANLIQSGSTLPPFHNTALNLPTLPVVGQTNTTAFGITSLASSGLPNVQPLSSGSLLPNAFGSSVTSLAPMRLPQNLSSSASALHNTFGGAGMPSMATAAGVTPSSSSSSHNPAVFPGVFGGSIPSLGHTGGAQNLSTTNHLPVTVGGGLSLPLVAHHVQESHHILPSHPSMTTLTQSTMSGGGNSSTGGGMSGLAGFTLPSSNFLSQISQGHPHFQLTGQGSQMGLSEINPLQIGSNLPISLPISHSAQQATRGSPNAQNALSNQQPNNTGVRHQLPPTAAIPMAPLTHPFPGLSSGLQNPASLSLLPTSMYPAYPYGGLPALPAVNSEAVSTSGVVRLGGSGFPTQTIMSGYPSYMSSSLYGNLAPVTTSSFTR